MTTTSTDDHAAQLEGRAPKWNQNQFDTMKQIDAPPCLDVGKAQLIKSMSSTEQGFLVFMRNELKLGDVLSKLDFEEAAKAMADFKREREACPE